MADRPHSPWQQLLDGLRRTPILLCGLLILATVALYLPVSHFEFLRFDDDAYVTQNPHVQSGPTLENVQWAFTEVSTFYWHPVTWLSHMLDCRLFGLDAGAHHSVNLALHAINVLLLFGLLQRATGAVWRSFMVAALFALHPLNVESVAWIAERKSLLSALFSLLTLAAYGWYVRRPSWKRYLAVMGMFLLALMSKPMAVTLPVLLLLLDYWPLRRAEDVPSLHRWRHLAQEKLPLLMMSAGSTVVTAIGHRYAMVSLAKAPLAGRLQNALVSYAAYARKIFWPHDLSSFYPPRLYPIPLTTLLAAAALLGGITAAIVFFRQKRYPVAGWVWFLIALLPVSGVVQAGTVTMADRFTYVPGIGILVMTVWGAAELMEKAKVPQIAAALVSLSLALGIGVASRHYLLYWHDGVSLFEHVRAVAPRPDYAIEQSLADALFFAGRMDDAFPHYQAACKLNPEFDLCHFDAAEVLLSRGQLPDALQEFQLARQHTANQALALASFLNSGAILLKLGQPDAAENDILSALKLDPQNAAARSLLEQVPGR